MTSHRRRRRSGRTTKLPCFRRLPEADARCPSGFRNMISMSRPSSPPCGPGTSALAQIVEDAKRRWDIYDALVIHRVGPLSPSDQIVLVAVTSAHRGESFAACQFIMDYLKTRAPFWKKEQTPEGERWVEARASDEDAAARW